MKKRVIGVIVTLIVLIVLGGGVGVVYMLSQTAVSSGADSLVYVSEVSEILEGFSFTSNRYNGAVETQELVTVNADLDKKVAKVLVSEGDEVKKGDKLFEYDVEEMQLKLDQLKLDVEQGESMIKSYDTQIESLEKEKKNATANKQLSLTNEIESLKLQKKQQAYSNETNQKEIEKLEKSVKNNAVKANLDGIVKTVTNDTTGTSVAIASDGDYRIKAMVSENNVGELYEGAEILIRSRIDDSTWTGKVTSVDTSNPVQTTNDYGTETTTKYPVYISLDDTTGLMVGQHVTVELDLGIGEEDEKEGLWLYDYYIADADTQPYVWVEDENNLIAKRPVELGKYDEVSMKYEILSGLTENDYIAFPEDRITEGMFTTRNIEDISYDDMTVGGEAEDGGFATFEDGDTVNAEQDDTYIDEENAGGIAVEAR